MKTIGLIGGTSWTSTAEYYRYINEETALRYGGLTSAEIVMVSINFAELEQAMNAGRWDNSIQILARAAAKLQAANADIILLCSNLIHRMFDDIQGMTSIPLLHIGDTIAAEIKISGLSTVALLGAKPTMEEGFYKQRIKEKSGADVIIPSPDERDYINGAIFQRLCRNIYTDNDRQAFIAIIENLQKRGAQSIILGCTEFPILLSGTSYPLINSTQLHSIGAVDFAMSPIGFTASMDNAKDALQIG